MAITDNDWLNNQSSSDQNLRLDIIMKLEKLKTLRDKAFSLSVNAATDINKYYWGGYILGINDAIKEIQSKRNEVNK